MKTTTLFLTLVITAPAYCQTIEDVQRQAAEQVERFRAMAAEDAAKWARAFDLKAINQPPKPTAEDLSRYGQYTKGRGPGYMGPYFFDAVSVGDFIAVGTQITPAAKREAMDRAATVLSPGSGIVLGSVIQVISADTALVKSQGVGRQTLWVTGFSTDGLTERQDVKCTSYGFKVTGTKTYNSTGGGTTTVFVVEPFDYYGLEKAKAKAKQDTLDANLEARREHRTRTFTDLSGKFSVKAEYTEYKDGNVMLRRLDNEMVIAIPLSKLSDADRKWVSEELAWERKNLR